MLEIRLYFEYCVKLLPNENSDDMVCTMEFSFAVADQLRKGAIKDLNESPIR